MLGVPLYPANRRRDTVNFCTYASGGCVRQEKSNYHARWPGRLINKNLCQYLLQGAAGSEVQLRDEVGTKIYIGSFIFKAYQQVWLQEKTDHIK